MELKRETITKEIGGHVFEIKAWLNAREERAINSVLFQNFKMNPTAKGSDIRDGKGVSVGFNEIPASVIQEQQLEVIKQFIVSIDNNSENILERCLDMRSVHFDKLLAELDEIQKNQGLE